MTDREAERAHAHVSEESFDRRLREVSQLYRLWLEIEKARRAGPIAEPLTGTAVRRSASGEGSAQGG